ncbi:carcinoembryonic antigen-related cell adhesion molecule 5-like isoform X1 [Hemiscyllium ocellatum]|uniref:carcinoembryonic antigen-related cell adhesion molecule 5-like isoform X1 n=1 Tax=Hemiscyllium ocellatum TaxID=170820 RepID=UPI002965F3C8|nr:carcinoembryonic antigen-related cell adhesion molecule 5-like isoform X1 [Hemiscyllium ocellatum]
MKVCGVPLFVCTIIFSSVDSAIIIVSDGWQEVDAAVGSQILLSLANSSELRSGSWRFNCSDVAFWISNITDISNDYSGRAELSPSGSLTLKSLTINDSGDYIVTMNPPFSNASVMSRIVLNVIEPVSKPEISVSSSEVVEDNGTVTLHCNLTGHSPSIQWIKDGQYLQYNDRMNMSSDNHTLILTAVNRSDTGDYQCEGYNTVSRNISDVLSLIVYFGPEDLRISIDPDKEDITVGSNVTFNCSAQSVPTPEFEWFFQGHPLNQTGQMMTIARYGPSHNGIYMCQVYNNMTGKYANVTTEVHVVEPVSKPNITADVSDPVEHNDTVSLTCHVTGDLRYLNWMKANQFIQNNERVKLSEGNVTLSILSVNRSDSGNYTCQAWGYRNNETSNPFELNVYYGPDTPQLTIEDEKEMYARESDIVLRCTADSFPPATFEWLLNGISLQQTSETLTLSKVNISDFGNYTCKAYNNRTMLYAETTKKITAIEDISKPEITANALSLVEHNGTAVLTCGVFGSWHSLRWSRDQNALLPGENVELSDRNKTLTIKAVNRSDAGNYTCTVESLISSKESDPFPLVIYYGPDEAQIVITSKEQKVSYGANVTLECKIESFPPSNYKWFLNGEELPHHGKVLVVSNITQGNSGNYTCQGYNVQTRMEKKNTIHLSPLESNDLEDYKNKSWIAAAVVGILALIAICACIIFKQRGS